MNFLKFIFCVLIWIVCISGSSCSKDSVTPIEAQLSSDSTSLNFAAVASSSKVKITMNGKFWSASSNQTWCTLSLISSTNLESTVTVFAQENTTTLPRTSVLKFVMDKATISINVSQHAGVEKSFYPSYSKWTARDQTGMTDNSFQLTKKITLGWNLGNSLEVPGGETGWGNPKVTEAFVDSVKKAGINAIRLPCAWDSYIENPSTCLIKASWLARVKEVVDYCYKNDMYVIVNIHWDGGWLENNPTVDKQKTVNAKQKALWEQISMYFKDYDGHLLFAGSNEVHVDGTPTSDNFTVQNSFNQTFVDAVRSTGGKNTYRNLIIQAYNTNIDQGVSNMVISKDSIANRLFVEVHYYDPWDFCGLESDASWATVKNFWGADYAQYGEISTWGQEDYVRDQFQKTKTSFVDKGYPVILGEFGAIRRLSLTGNDLEHHLDSRAYFLKYVIQEAKNHGLIPFLWDNGSLGNLGAGVFDRNDGSIFDQQVLDSLQSGAVSGVYPF